jgi:hypothetical protein
LLSKNIRKDIKQEVTWATTLPILSEEDKGSKLSILEKEIPDPGRNY